MVSLTFQFSSYCFFNVPHCKFAILSTCRFAYLLFNQLALTLSISLFAIWVLSTCHCTNLPYCQYAIFKVAISLTVWLSIYCFVNVLFHQFAIM